MLNSIYEKVTNLWFMSAMVFLFILIFVFGSYQTVGRNSIDIYAIDDRSLVEAIEPYDVAIVFGGGIDEKGPLPLLKDRLDTAKRLLDMGYVNKILLSGDNRTEEYSEPEVMFEYLIENGVSSQSLVEDFAGRSTYETCERANKIFGLEKAVLISEKTHLPRARYLCGHFRLETIGVASEGIATAGSQVGQTWREFLARPKAVLNIYLYGEKTVLGEPQPIN